MTLHLPSLVAIVHAHTFALAPEGEHAATGPLGLPLWTWQLANLVGFFGLLLYFVARPVASMFRNKQLEVIERAKEARERRAEAARFETEIHARMAQLDRDVAEIRARSAADGEAARVELLDRADQEAVRVRQDVEAEIARRLAAAKDELRQTAADLTAAVARELVAGQITAEDRRRLLDESVSRLGGQS